MTVALIQVVALLDNIPIAGLVTFHPSLFTPTTPAHLTFIPKLPNFPHCTRLDFLLPAYTYRDHTHSSANCATHLRRFHSSVYSTPSLPPSLSLSHFLLSSSPISYSLTLPIALSRPCICSPSHISLHDRHQQTLGISTSGHPVPLPPSRRAVSTLHLARRLDICPQLRQLLQVVRSGSSAYIHAPDLIDLLDSLDSSAETQCMRNTSTRYISRNVPICSCMLSALGEHGL